MSRNGGTLDRLRFAGVSVRARHLASPVLFVIVAGLVLLPLLVMIAASFRPAGVLPLNSGPLTFRNYDAIASSSFGSVFVNTVVYVVGTLLVAVPLAFALAYVTERTDIPLRNALYVAMFFPLLMPGFASALGWILLAGPRAGILNVYLRDWLHLHTANGPLDVFTMPGMILVSALTFIPSMWLLLISVLRGMDATLEDAASTEGARRSTVLWTVTLPLMRPGVLAVVIYYAIVISESFEIPLALGLTAGVQVISTRIYLLVTSSATGLFNYGGAAAIGMVGVILGFAGIYAYRRVLRHASSYAVVTGKSYSPRLVKLGAWKYPALLLVGLYCLLNMALPLATIVYTSFLRYYVPPTPGELGDAQWTLDNYKHMLDFEYFGRPLIHTLLVALIAATITSLIAGLVSWSDIRIGTRLARATNMVSFVPLAIPGTIVTLAFFLTFLNTALYGSLVLMVLAFVTRYLSYSTRLMYAAQLQIHSELEEASLTSGAGGVGTFLRINLRILLPAFVNSWLWVLAHASKDFTTPLLLATSSSVVLANVIFGAFTGGSYPETCSLMVALIVFMSAVVLTMRRTLVRDIRS